MLKYFSNPYVACTIVFIALSVNYAKNRTYPIIQEDRITQVNHFETLRVKGQKNNTSYYFIIHHNGKYYRFLDTPSTGVTIVKNHQKGDFLKDMTFYYSPKDCKIINDNRELCFNAVIINAKYFSTKSQQFYDMHNPTTMAYFIRRFEIYVYLVTFYIISMLVFYGLYKKSKLGN